MKAAVIHEFGPANTLQITDVDKPVPNAEQVLIKIKAVGINPVDAKVRSGVHSISKKMELPAILGWDISGVIEQCGIHVTEFKDGDEVFGSIGFPGLGKAYAEFAVADPVLLTKKPGNISFEEAAAVPIAGLTAYQSINEYLEIKSGQTILVQAAAGGVGHFAVQFAKINDALVFGTASEKNRNFLQSLGVTRAIDYKHEKFEDMVDDLDAVQDAFGGDILYRSIACVKQGGRVVCLPSSTKNDPKALELAEKQGVKLMWPMMHPDAEQMQIIANLLEAEKVKVHVDKIFSLDEIVKAHEAIETHRTVGKIVVKI